jgi:hypothetical protein
MKFRLGIQLPNNLYDLTKHDEPARGFHWKSASQVLSYYRFLNIVITDIQSFIILGFFVVKYCKQKKIVQL